jgi:hypothetical protein
LSADSAWMSCSAVMLWWGFKRIFR